MMCLNVSQAKEELKCLIEENNNLGVRGIADIDSRVGKLNKRLAELEEALELVEKVSELNTWDSCINTVDFYRTNSNIEPH